MVAKRSLTPMEIRVADSTRIEPRPHGLERTNFLQFRHLLGSRIRQDTHELGTISAVADSRPNYHCFSTIQLSTSTAWPELDSITLAFRAQSGCCRQTRSQTCCTGPDFFLECSAFDRGLGMCSLLESVAESFDADTE